MDQEYDMESKGYMTWPETMPVSEPDGLLVRLTGLSEIRKKEAWKEIQASNPALAALLKESALQQVVKAFDADIFIDAAFAPSLPPDRLRGRAR